MRKGLLGTGLLLLVAGAAYVYLQLWLRSDSLRQTLETQAAVALGMPVRIDRAKASLFPRLNIQLSEVTVGEPPQARVDQAAIGIGLDALWSRRIENADVQLTAGQIDSSWLGWLAANTQTPSGSSNGPVNHAPITVASIQSIRLRDMVLTVAGDPIPISLDASLDGDRLTLTGGTARIGEATLNIGGEILSLARREGHFTVRARTLPIGELLALIGSATATRSAGPPASHRAPRAPVRITADIAAPAATLGGRRVDAFASTLEVTQSGIVLSPTTFNLDGGRFEMRLGFSAFGDPTNARLEADGRVSGLDVAQLQTATSTRTETVTGRLDATFAITTPPVADLHAMIGDARGSIDVTIRDGRMPGIAVVRQTVLRFANRAGPPPRMDATDAFSGLDASLRLDAGAARITRLRMKAADFDLDGLGALSPRDWRLAIAATVTLTEELSQQAGRDLYRYAHDGRRVVLPVIVGGTLFEPTATIDVSKAAARAIRNRVEEEAHSLLEQLLKKRPPE